MHKPLLLLSILQSALALSSEQWQPISVGLMMQRSYDPTCPSTHDHLMKRSVRQSRRDYKQTVGSIQRMDTGGILLPGEFEDGLRIAPNASMQGKQAGNHQHKRQEDGFQTVITWYTGGDLLDQGKWAPTDDSMIAAVTLNWAQKPPCGSFLQLRRKKELTSTSISTTAPATSTAKPTKYADSIIVRVMDSCAGCKAGTAHVDLTKAAFKSLYALDIGLVTDIEVKLLKNPPFDKWGKKEESLYGPQNLGKPKASRSSGKNSGPDWQDSGSTSTNKNTSPNWTSDAAPRVLAQPTQQNQVTGDGSGKGKGKTGSSTMPPYPSGSNSGNGKGRKTSETESTPEDQDGPRNWGSW